MKRICIILLLILISGCSQIVYEKEQGVRLEGPYEVLKVVDGDTLDVLIDGEERVRLSGINTPEKDECYYEEAKEKWKN